MTLATTTNETAWETSSSMSGVGAGLTHGECWTCALLWSPGGWVASCLQEWFHVTVTNTISRWAVSGHNLDSGRSVEAHHLFHQGQHSIDSHTFHLLQSIL